MVEIMEDYRDVERDVRERAGFYGALYNERVPQANWLTLDVDGAVLMSQSEYGQLPEAAKRYFEEGNQFGLETGKTIALRGPNVARMESHYSMSPSGERATDYFLYMSERSRLSAEAALRELAFDRPEQWKARLAICDNLACLAVAQFHALTAASLMGRQVDREDLVRSEQAVTTLFDAYYATVLGMEEGWQQRDKSIIEAVDDMSTLVGKNRHELRELSQYDLFRTEREVMGPQALMSAYAWVSEGRLKGVDLAVGLLLGGVDEHEAVKFLQTHADELGFGPEHFPREMRYILSKICAVGKTSRSSRERTGNAVVDLRSDYQGDRLLEGIRFPIRTVALLDDSMSTGKSTEGDISWLARELGLGKTAFFVLATRVGTRWAQPSDLNDVADPEVLIDLGAVAVSPTRRQFLGKWGGLETMLFRLVVRERMMRANRLNPHGIIARMRELKAIGAVGAVGFDVYGTLVETDRFDRYTRREGLNRLFAGVLQKYGLGEEMGGEELVDWFAGKYKEVRKAVQQEAIEAADNDAEFDESDVFRRIVGSFTGDEGVVEAVVDGMLRAEVEQELQSMRVVPGMGEVVREALTLFGPERVGIFSNTYLPKEYLIMLLGRLGLLDEDMIQANLVLASSDPELKTKKPNPVTMHVLAGKLGVETRNMMFVGDTFETDVLGAEKARAVSVQLVQ